MPTPYTGSSIVDYLRSTGADSSFANRKKLAEAQGITGYVGSADQNLKLLGTLNAPKTQTTQGPAGSVSPNTGQAPDMANFNATPRDGISASGRFDGLTDEEIQQLSIQNDNVIGVTQPGGGFASNDYQPQQPGESAAQYANRIRNSRFEMAGDYTPGGEAPKTLSFAESVGMAQKAGLKGIADNAFAGLTDAQAARKAKELRQFYQNQTSQNTTGVFNPETVKGVKKTVEKFKLALDEISNDPFLSSGSKTDRQKSYFESTAVDIAKNFGSKEDFMANYQNNPEIQKSLQAFIAAGGSLDQITSKIGDNENKMIVDSRKNAVQGLMDQGITDPETILDYVNFDDQGNQVGDFTIEEVQSYMNGDKSTTDFLASLGEDATPQARAAEEALIPERQATQDQIIALANIPEQYRKLYFGTPEELGILAQKKANAEEAKRILEEREADEKTTLREKAQFEIEKNAAEMANAIATIEENRLTAKNYMTAKLAKLGALQTTGNAPLAIATLDQKYQQQKANTEAIYKNKARSIEISLGEALNKTENDTDEEILKIKQDLTKSSDDVAKEILKAELASQKEIMQLRTTYATKLRQEVDKYTKEAKTASDKYTKEYISLASKGFDVNSIEAILAGNPEGAKIPVKGSKSTTSLGKTARDLGFSSDTDYKYFMTLPKEFRDMYIRDVTRSGSGAGNIQKVTDAFNFYKQEKPRFTVPKTKSSTTTTSKSSSGQATIDDL